MVSAEVARQVIDRWLAQYMWTLLKKHLPYGHAGRQGMGRVKAVILDLIAQHEASVKQHNSTTLKVKLIVNGREVKGQVANVPASYLKMVAERIEKTGKPITAKNIEKYTLVDIQSDMVEYEPFSRSTLEIMSLAWQKHRMMPATTMRILQQLYEGNS